MLKRLVCFRCGGTGHKTQYYTTSSHNEKQLTTTGSEVRSNSFSDATNHHIFTTFGKEGYDSLERYEMEGVTLERCLVTYPLHLSSPAPTYSPVATTTEAYSSRWK